MNRFYVPPENITGKQVRFSDDQRKQIRNVLRLQLGDKVAVVDGSGQEYLTEIMTLDGEKALGQILDAVLPDTEPNIRLILFQSLPKGEKIELVLQKCTEIGVSKFIITETSRSIPRIPAERMASRLERWRSIVREAVEQSGRTRLPPVSGVLSFDDALARASECDCRIIAWEQGKQPSLTSILPKLAGVRELAYFVGPEGGFTGEEIMAAKGRGVIPVSLGPRILRAETAAIVGAGILIYGSEAACE